MPGTTFATVDDYIASFSPRVQDILHAVRRAIREGAPEADELISYKMPAYRFHGLLIYFAAFTKHYSLFCPRPELLFDAFKEDLAPYKTHKSTIKFPIERPVPVDLIRRMARHRADEYRSRKI